MEKRSSLQARPSAYLNIGNVSVAQDVTAAESCVLAAGACHEILLDGLESFEAETQELLRLSRVLQNNRVRILICVEWSEFRVDLQVFTLVPEKRVKAYAAQQYEDIESQVTELLGLAEKSIKLMERKEKALKMKVESLQNKEPEVSIEARNDARKAKMLIKQRELLEKELIALEKECAALERCL
ncbi:uncharacterized protein EI90DRAFT_3117943 [Cantharellus anzutake]|uniref:uncharacterized protein n=1 Tax=Cantharellus anzutake TaxID=1750568 RepID=UPI00190545BD|nr:uncharacterized protein EI90DRAFT_3117943 [Cantharellus anzutake]KAF8338870.1 hypothetical protein EI90DRAFT_3117943 [Cantharellus anzutake]